MFIRVLLGHGGLLAAGKVGTMPTRRRLPVTYAIRARLVRDVWIRSNLRKKPASSITVLRVIPCLHAPAKGAGSQSGHLVSMMKTGSTIGTFEIITLLGRGGMGEVYRARDTRLDRDVAIKVLPEQLARDAERIARFQREAKVLAS